MEKRRALGFIRLLPWHISFQKGWSRYAVFWSPYLPVLQKTGQSHPHLVAEAAGGVPLPPLRRHLQYLPLPLVYVFALVAVFAGVAIYFFHKFILDDITLTTGIQVVIPFAVFFLLSLFMVYLAKPVIKKVPRAQVDRKRRNKGNFEERRMPAGRQGQTGQIFYDGEDYQPHTNYRAGPMPQEQGDEDMKIVEPRESRPAYGETSVQRTVVAAPREEIASQRPRVQAEASHTPAAAPPGPPAADGTEPGSGPAGPARRPGGCPGEARRSGELRPACRPAPSLRAGAGTGPCRAPEGSGGAGPAGRPARGAGGRPGQARSPGGTAQSPGRFLR